MVPDLLIKWPAKDTNIQITIESKVKIAQLFHSNNKQPDAYIRLPNCDPRLEWTSFSWMSWLLDSPSWFPQFYRTSTQYDVKSHWPMLSGQLLRGGLLWMVSAYFSILCYPISFSSTTGLETWLNCSKFLFPFWYEGPIFATELKVWGRISVLRWILNPSIFSTSIVSR